MADVLDGRVFLRGGVAAGAAMYLVRYARHGCSFPQQGIAGCVVSLMVDSGCRRKRRRHPKQMETSTNIRQTALTRRAQEHMTLVAWKSRHQFPSPVLDFLASITGSTIPLAIPVYLALSPSSYRMFNPSPSCPSMPSASKISQDARALPHTQPHLQADITPLPPLTALADRV